MIFKTLEEALQSNIKLDKRRVGLGAESYKEFEKYSPLEYDLKFGDHFLYQIVTDEGAYYPKMAVFIKDNIFDQAYGFDFINRPRVWEQNTTFINENKYENSISDLPSEISVHIEWTNFMLIFGKWKQFPSWKELRQAYERTIWFYKGLDWYRNTQLNRIL